VRTPGIAQTVRLATAGQSGDRATVGLKFFASAQNGLVAHPASCTMGTGSFPRVNRPGRGVDHPPLPSAEVKEIVNLYFYSPSGPSWPVIGRTSAVSVLIYCRTCKMQLSIICSCSAIQLLSHTDVTEIMSHVSCDYVVPLVGKIA
jgi:hypothetical protein